MLPKITIMTLVPLAANNFFLTKKRGLDRIQQAFGNPS
jgi:hypothetical protein